MAALTQKLSSKKTQLQLLRVITHIGALLPLLWLYADYYTYNLGANEPREATLRLGKTAIILLVLSLSCTPVSTLLGWRHIVPLRKPLGLYAFFYVCLHLLAFAGWDYGFQLGIVWEEIVLRRYALVGFLAFLLLIPLAATSTKWAMRKLGKNWKKLHKLVYVVAILAVIHYWWLVKENLTQPIIFAVIVGGLLFLRLPAVKQQIRGWRRQIRRRLEAVTQS